jgi:hypothetical protein
MRNRVLVRAALAAVVISTCAANAGAQQYESVGIRAQGMAGAFVAVADDASATWWNPAGLATGAYLDSLLEYSVVQQPRQERGASGEILPASETKTRGVAIVFPAAGLSYYRIQISEIRPVASTAEQGSGRQTEGATAARLRTVRFSQYGATFGQSVGNHLVVASTLKVVRGSVANSEAAAADATFDQAAELDGDTDTHTDLDVGALASLGVVRLGLSVKNVRTPSFGPPEDREELMRRARAGLAIVKPLTRVLDQFTIAVDADLTTASSVVGDTKYVTGGAEAWLFGKRVGLRGGLSRNTVGSELSSPSGGISLAFRQGSYLEGQYTAGDDRSRKGWGFDLRVTF